MRAKTALGILALVVAASAAACGGGSGDGGTVAPALIAADFVAEEPSPPANSVALAKGSVNNDLVTVRVEVTNVNNLYGAAFNLNYDGNMAEYVRFSPGTILESGGVTPTYTVSSPQPGLVVVGASRTGAASGVTITGSRPLILITFRVRQAGDNPMTIPASSAALFNNQLPPAALGGISWFAGALKGTQT